MQLRAAYPRAKLNNEMLIISIVKALSTGTVGGTVVVVVVVVVAVVQTPNV